METVITALCVVLGFVAVVVWFKLIDALTDEFLF